MKKEMKIYTSTIGWIIVMLIATLMIVATNHGIKIDKKATPYFASISAATKSMNANEIQAELKEAKSFIDSNTNLQDWSLELDNAITSAEYLIKLYENNSDNLMVETAKMQEMLKEQSFSKNELTLYSALDYKFAWMGDLTLVFFMWCFAAMLCVIVMGITYQNDEVIFIIPVAEKKKAA